MLLFIGWKKEIKIGLALKRRRQQKDSKKLKYIIYKKLMLEK